MSTFKNNELISITAEEAKQALARQIEQIGNVGDVDLFGDVRTIDNIRTALREVSRVANDFSAKVSA